MEVSYKKKSKE